MFCGGNHILIEQRTLKQSRISKIVWDTSSPTDHEACSSADSVGSFLANVPVNLCTPRTGAPAELGYIWCVMGLGYPSVSYFRV